MKILHTINDPKLLTRCLQTVESGDALLLMENGVYCVTSPEFASLPKAISVYALQNDISARGLSDIALTAVTPIPVGDFVKLCCDHQKVINWF